MRKTAILSECLSYRYTLERIWDDTLPLLFVMMLNPSSADHEKSDPTVTTLIRFAMGWGYGGILIGNAYAFRTANPAKLRLVADPVGPENSIHLMGLLTRKNVGAALVAWGNNLPAEIAGEAAERIRSCGFTPMCMGTTLSGAPKHPLARGKHRIPRDQQLVEWAYA